MAPLCNGDYGASINIIIDGSIVNTSGGVVHARPTFTFYVIEEENMKSLRYFASFTAVALILSAGAFAKDNKSGSFDLSEPAQVGSTTLQPGHYKAEWTGSGDALNVSILEHGKTVATVQGAIKQLPSKATVDEVTLKPGNDNNKQIEEIEFSNHSEALIFGM